MHVMLIQVQVKPEHVEEFIRITRDNHLHSVREPGNMRFDVLQLPDDPTRFMLYEAYVDVAAAEQHRETEHYLHWRDTVEAWMASPRERTRWVGLYPESKS